MTLLLLIVIILVFCGGGGGYYYHRTYRPQPFVQPYPQSQVDTNDTAFVAHPIVGDPQPFQFPIIPIVLLLLVLLVLFGGFGHFYIHYF